MTGAGAHLVPVYPRGGVQFVRGEGARLFDAEGRSWLDFLSGIGVNALGHAHPRLLEALTSQARRLVHTSNLWGHPLQDEAAARIAAATGLPRIFFTNSGTEAVEACLKMARRWQRARGEEERTGFVALEGAFHGRTLGALSVTWTAAYREPFAPLLPGVRFVPRNDAAALAAALREDRPAALVLEPIQGEAGVVVLDGGFLREARALCTATSTLLIHDEVQSGCGRTGTFLAAAGHGVTPDLVALAKPLGGGLPVGCAAATEDVAAAMGPAEHGSTFAGGPLAAAAILAFLEELLEGGLMERAAETGARLLEGLRVLARATSCVREVRGAGLMAALVLDRPSRPVAEELFRRGLVAGAAGGNAIRFLPPYVVGPAEVEEALGILEHTCKDLNP